MKSTVSIVTLVVLALASCTGMPGAGGQNATLLPGFGGYGLQVVSASPWTGVSEAEIVLTSTQELTLMAMLTNVTTQTPTQNAARVERDGSSWRILVRFPQTGRYYVTLAARPASVSGDSYDAVAQWLFEAVVTPAPEEAGMVRQAAFDTYGLRVVSTTPRSGVADAQLVLDSDQDLALIASLKDSATGKYVPSGAEVVREGEAWKVVAVFPASGSYELTVSAKPAADTGNTYYGAASWVFDALVSADAGFAKKPAFDIYGLSVVSATPQDGVRDAEIMLKSDQELDLYYAVVPAGTELKTLQSLQSVGTGRWAVPALFETSGEWLVAVYAKLKTEKNLRKAGSWRFQAVVKDGPARFVRFTTYGMKVITEPSAVAGADTELVVAADLDLRLTATLRNRATGASENLGALPDGGQRWRIPIYFPASGSFELVLTGRPASDTGYTSWRLARWTLDATVPAGDITYRSFARLGARLVSQTSRTGVAEAQLVLSLPGNLSLVASLAEHATGKRVEGALTARTDAGWQALALFPATGEYDLVLSALPGDAPYGTQPERLVRLTCQATVGPAAAGFVYRRPDGFSRIRLSEMTDAPDEPPVVAWSGHAPAKRGVLAEDLDLRFNTASLRLPKGTPILLDPPGDGGRVLGQFMYTPSTPISLKVGDLQIDTPRSSRYVFTWWNAVLIELAGEASVTLGRISLRASENIVFTEEGNERYVSIVLPADTPITLGGTTNTWPAGSQVFFDAPYRHISRILVTEDTTVTSGGTTTSLEAWYAALFDASGALTGTQAMGK